MNKNLTVLLAFCTLLVPGSIQIKLLEQLKIKTEDDWAGRKKGYGTFQITQINVKGIEKENKTKQI